MTDTNWYYKSIPAKVNYRCPPEKGQLQVENFVKDNAQKNMFTEWKQRIAVIFHGVVGI